MYEYNSNEQIDSLTQLINKECLLDIIKTKLEHSAVMNKLALLCIEFDDLDRFNDVFGYDIDDQLIVQLSRKINDILEVDSVLSRVGGYQFAILMHHDAIKDKAYELAEKIIGLLKEPFCVGENMFYVTASIGISILSSDISDAYKLLKTAENTMRKVQKNGHNNIAFTKLINDESLKKEIELMRDLPSAIDNGEIYFVYQGQYSHDKQKFIGAEMLSRWNHPKYGYISPFIFINLAEKSGMIGPLTIKLLIEASKMFEKLEKDGISDFSLSLNISPIVLMEKSFYDTIVFLLESYNLKGKNLTFEIMEDTVSDNIENFAKLLNKIKDLGIKIAIDDYGTGHTSLSYLINLPIDYIKIDRSFVTNIDKETKKFLLLKSIIDMANTLDMKVVVEGVEEYSEDDLIKMFKDMTIQGYLYCKPIEADEFMQKVK
jgi:diguanylate cyclase (GGDEF)-like protein